MTSRVSALVRLRYRTRKLRALMWALRHLMGRAERLSRQGGSHDAVINMNGRRMCLTRRHIRPNLNCQAAR
jgi:hypothetical protein